jgi:hypothetical protein
MKQTIVKTITGVEWTCMMIVRSLADKAVDRTEWVKDASSWGEWEDTEVTERKEVQESKRTVQKERWLWKRLEESDRKQAKEERYNNLKKNRKFAKAREKIKVGKDQPGIMDKLRRAVPVSHVQGGAAKEPGVQCQGDGDIQPGDSQAHEVQPDQQETVPRSLMTRTMYQEPGRVMKVPTRVSSKMMETAIVAKIKEMPNRMVDIA